MDRPGSSYGTDVSDDVWTRLLPLLWVEREEVSESQLRAVLNIILYRRRTGLGWRQLPFDLTPTDLARAYDERWREDGTWECLLGEMTPAAASSPPVLSPSPSLARRALRKGARLGRAALEKVKRTAFGRLAVRVVRGLRRRCGIIKGLPSARAMTVRVVRGLRRRFDRLVQSWLPEPTSDASRPLPGDPLMPVSPEAEQAEQANQARRIQGEIMHFSRLIEIDPRNHHAFFRRAGLYQELGHNRAAAFDAWRCYALIGNQGGELPGLHSLLARILVCLGDVDRSLMHMFQYIWLCRSGQIHASVLAGEGPPSDAQGLQVWIEAHDNLAEEAINISSDFALAFRLYRQKVRYQRQFVETFGVASLRTLYLSEDWVRNVGHMALLDFWIKLAKLGWRSWDQRILLAPENGTANYCYLDYWRAHYTVVSDPHLYPLVRPFGQALGHRVASLLELPGGKDAYFLEGMGAIQEEWERQGRGPLLSLTAEDREHGRKVMAELGVPADAWFVSLHVRTPGFHQESDLLHQAHRNADILSYLPAIKEITRRGGWVVRLGDASMPPLPALPGVIDYALSPFKSAAMDVYLLGTCRFFVGVASGLSHLPTTFGVPCVFTNWVSNTLPVYSSLDLFLPKLRWSKKEDRCLTFDEWLAPEARALCYSGTKMAEHDLAVVDNTPEELREVIVEMFERLDEKAHYTEGDRQRLESFRNLARHHGLIGFSQIGRDYLRRHAALLPPCPRATALPFAQVPVKLGKTG